MLNQYSKSIMNQLYLFSLDRLGAQKFGKATTDNLGKRLAIVLDGEIVAHLLLENLLHLVMGRFQEILPFKRQQS